MMQTEADKETNFKLPQKLALERLGEALISKEQQTRIQTEADKEIFSKQQQKLALERLGEALISKEQQRIQTEVDKEMLSKLPQKSAFERLGEAWQQRHALEVSKAEAEHRDENDLHLIFREMFSYNNCNAEKKTTEVQSTVETATDQYTNTFK